MKNKQLSQNDNHDNKDKVSIMGESKVNSKTKAQNLLDKNFTELIESENSFGEVLEFGDSYIYVFTVGKLKKEMLKNHNSATEQAIIKVLNLLDKIECEDENDSMEQWEQYKHIRNSIRDQIYDPIKKLNKLKG